MIQHVVWANLFHRRMRTVLAVAAISLEVTMILLILGLADGLVGESNRRQRGIGADILIRPSTSSSAFTTGSAGLPESIIGEIESMPGVQLAVGTAFSMQAQLTTVTGVDLEKFARHVGGLRFLRGHGFQRPFDIVVDEVHARQRKLSLGDTVRVLNRDFRLVGIVESGKLSRVFIPLETKQEVMDWAGKLSQVYVKLDDPAHATAFVQKLKARLPDNSIYTMEEFISLFTAQTRGMADYYVNAIVGIAVAVGFIVILISMYTAVLDRTRDIGILKSLGASPGYILQIFLRETLLLTAVGLVLGGGLAYLTEGVVEERFPLVTFSILAQPSLLDRGHQHCGLDSRGRIPLIAGSSAGPYYCFVLRVTIGGRRRGPLGVP